MAGRTYLDRKYDFVSTSDGGFAERATKLRLKMLCVNDVPVFADAIYFMINYVN